MYGLCATGDMPVFSGCGGSEDGGMRGEVCLSAHSIHPQPPPKWRPPQLCVLPPRATQLTDAHSASSAPRVSPPPSSPLPSPCPPPTSLPTTAPRPPRLSAQGGPRQAKSFPSTLRHNITPPSPSWRPTTPLCPTSRRAENQCPVFSATRGTMCRAVSPNGSRLSEVSSVKSRAFSRLMRL